MPCHTQTITLDKYTRYGRIRGCLYSTCIFIFSFIAVFSSIFFVDVSTSPAASDGIDRIVVIKNKHLMMLLKDGEIYKGYRIALGRQPSGHKIMAGDKRTPEGSYIIESKNPNSRFHLSLRVSYPNAYDIETAHKLGVSPGGDIMIHGLSPKLASLDKMHRYQDWTDGCIAVTNKEIEEIWRLVPDGIPIEIKP